MKIRTISILQFCCAAFFFACKHDPEVLPPVTPPTNTVPEDYGTNPIDTIETACDQDTIYFRNDILPIIISRCAMSGCHNEGNDGNNYIDLTSFQGISELVQDGMDSDLLQVINEDDPNDVMPKPGSFPLTPTEITLIERWVEQGAVENACNSCVTTTSFANDIYPIIYSNCIGCHSANNPDGNLSLTNHTQISNAASRIVSRIDGYGGIMPPQSNGIPTCEKEQIKSWIEAGKPNN